MSECRVCGDPAGDDGCTAAQCMEIKRDSAAVADIDLPAGVCSYDRTAVSFWPRPEHAYDHRTPTTATCRLGHRWQLVAEVHAPTGALTGSTVWKQVR